MTAAIALSHRRTTRTSEKGMSLVEATVIVMVLAALTAAIAPSMNDYVGDARQTAAKAEVEAIGTGILRLLSDTGSRCLRLLGDTDCSVTNRVDLLVTSGADPKDIDLTAAPDVTLVDDESATEGVVNWLPGDNAPLQRDLLEDQLIENDNTNPYAAVSFSKGGGPRMKLGWRGAYLTGPIAADPWNARYQVNALFLTVATNAIDTTGTPNQFQEGVYQGGWNRDVIVLSAGQNGIVETSFGGGSATAGVSAGGDDVAYVLRGSSR